VEEEIEEQNQEVALSFIPLLIFSYKTKKQAKFGKRKHILFLFEK
jgi:hypothetical protein